jgi:hypothetical protein
MAKAQNGTAIGLDSNSFRLDALLRMGCWGIGAAAAMFLAVLAGMSKPGATRIDGALAMLTGKAVPAVTTPSFAPRRQVTETRPDAEAQRLAKQIEELRAGRDRLLERLSVIERHLDDVTGSISRQEAARAKTPPPAPNAPLAAVTAALLPASLAALGNPMAPSFDAVPAVTSAALVAIAPSYSRQPAPRPPQTTVKSASAESESSSPSPTSAAEPSATPKTVSTRTGATPSVAGQRIARAQPLPGAAAVGQEHGTAHAYGVDLGGAGSIPRLRLLWNTVHASQTSLFGDLYPVSAPRQTLGGRPDFRLLAGPLATAEDASKLCTALLESGHFCEPVAFQGQRLPLR